MHAGRRVERRVQQCVGNALGGIDPPFPRKQRTQRPQHVCGERLAQAPLVTVAADQARAHQRERREPARAERRFEFALDPVVEHARLRVRPHRGIQHVDRRAVATREVCDRQRVVVVDAAECIARTRGLHRRAQCADDRVGPPPGCIGGQRVEIHQGRIEVRMCGQGPPCGRDHVRDARIGQRTGEHVPAHETGRAGQDQSHRRSPSEGARHRRSRPSLARRRGAADEADAPHSAGAMRPERSASQHRATVVASPRALCRPSTGTPSVSAMRGSSRFGGTSGRARRARAA